MWLLGYEAEVERWGSMGEACNADGALLLMAIASSSLIFLRELGLLGSRGLRVFFSFTGADESLSGAVGKTGPLLPTTLVLGGDCAAVLGARAGADAGAGAGAEGTLPSRRKVELRYWPEMSDDDGVV